MTSDQGIARGTAEQVAPIRHRLAVRPVLVSLKAKPKHPGRLDKPKHPGRLDKQANVLPDDACKQAKHEPSKSKHSKREAKKEKKAVEASKRDAHFLVQIPYGPLMKVPAGVPYCRIQHGNYKYSLLVDPTSGKLRHVHKRAA